MTVAKLAEDGSPVCLKMSISPRLTSRPLTGWPSFPRSRWGSVSPIVSKVTHRKRTRLIPLFDRAVMDRYRLVTGLRGEAAWPALVRALKADLALDENRLFLTGLGERAS